MTSDSLAGESLKGSGSFGEGNPKAAASSQPSVGSTTATTDTSGARRIDPAVDAEARDAASNWSEQAQLSAGSGLRSASGATSTQTDDVSGGYAGAADKVLEAEGGFKMPGKNVSEDPSLTGKREFGAIGTIKDPARVAELEQARKTAASGGVEAKGGLQEGGSKFSELKDEAA